MNRRAGEYGLVFADQPPPPARQQGRDEQPAKTNRGPRRAQLPPRVVVTDTHRAHGTHACYVLDRCGCQPCRDASTAYERRRRHAINRPDEVWRPYVAAGTARCHLKGLAAAGVGLKQVAKVSGLGHGVLSKLVYGDRARNMAPSRRIRQATADKILAVTVADVAVGAKIDGSRTWALVEELVAAGYTKTWIAGQLGRSVGNLRRRPLVRASTARAVAELHRRSIDRPAPARNTRWGPR